MREIKRAVCCIMAVMLVFSGMLTSTTTATDATNIGQAKIVLDKVVEKQGFSVAEFADQGESVAARGNEFGWLLDITKVNQKGTINFTLSDEFKPVCDFDGTEYEIDIEYFNELDSFFTIYYDSYDDVRKRGETIYTENEKMWKTTTIKLDDAVFNKRLDGKYDFAISVTLPQGPYVRAWYSWNSVVIRSVTVRKIPKENPLFITAEVQGPGNSFRWHAEEKLINMKLDNVSGGELNGEVTYKILSADMQLLFEKTESINMAAGEKKEAVLDIGGVTECGIHSLETEIKTDDKQSQRLVTKLAVIKADPDGIRNKDVSYATYFYRNRNPEGAVEGVELLDMSNVYGGRVGIDWFLRYDAASKEVYPKAIPQYEGSVDLADVVINEQVKYGMQPTAIFMGTPAISGVIEYQDIPGTTDLQLEYWEDYVRAIAEEYKGKIGMYEVWNEPNIPSFNPFMTGGEILGKAAIAAAETVAEVDPDAIVAGCGFVGLDYSYGDSGRAYYDKTMEAGMWQAMDWLSVHNYSWGIPESYCERYVNEIGAMSEDWKKYKGEYPKIWSTEAGFHGTIADINYDHQKKGSYTARQIIFFKEHGILDGPFTIHAFDPTNLIKTEREASFGHVSPGHEEMSVYGTMFFPNEAFLTISGYNYAMAETEYEETFNSENQNVRIRKFHSDKFDTKVLTLNTVGESEFVTLNLGTDSVRYFDTFGNENVIYGNNGVFSLAITGDPTYIVGDIKKVEYLDSHIVEYSGTEFRVAEDDILAFTIKNNTDKDYKVVLDTPAEAEFLDKNIGFEGGRATIRLHNKAKKDTEYAVYVKIMDGEKVVQMSKIKVKSSESATLTMDFQMSANNDVDRWQGILKIRNESATKPIKGTFSFKLPEVFAGMDPVDVGLIPAGRTGEIIFNLPKLVRKGEYSFECELKADDGRIFKIAFPRDFTIAKYAKNKPTIDGVIDSGEWYLNTAVYADTIQDAIMIDDFIKSEWQGPEDLSGRNVIMWDEEYIYALFEVTDNIFFNAGKEDRYWETDGIQMGIVFDEIGDVRIGQAHTKFHEFGLNLFPSGSVIRRSMCQEDVHPLGIVDYGELAVKNTGTKTVYEFKMAWKDMLLEGDQPKLGDVLGFSFLINDNDGEGRRGWVEYASGIGMSKSTQLFTYITLID